MKEKRYALQRSKKKETKKNRKVRRTNGGIKKFNLTSLRTQKCYRLLPFLMNNSANLEPVNFYKIAVRSRSVSFSCSIICIYNEFD